MKTVARPRGAAPDFLGLDEIATLAGGLCAVPDAREKLDFLRVRSAWNRAAGAHLRGLARPSCCASDHLFVDVESAAWKRELDRLKPEILSRLAAALGEARIGAITFRVRPSGAMPSPGGAAVSSHRTSASGGAPASCGSAVDSLDDRLRIVMEKYLSRAGGPARA